MATRRAFLFLMFVTIIGLTTLVFFLSQPKITPTARLEAEQQIYALLLTDRRIGGEDINPILDHTTLGDFQESASEKDFQIVVDGFPSLERETLVDFQEQNSISYPIKDFLPLINNDPLIKLGGDEQAWWISFSRIGFSSSLDQALVIAEQYAACQKEVCKFGTGNFIVLHKVDGKWFVENFLEIWNMHPT